MEPRETSPIPFDTLTDEEVLGRVIAGETALFEVVMRRYNQRTYRAVRAILKDADEVEDAMQEAYISAHSHLASFSGRARFSTWLVRIAVNEALARLRRSKRVTSLDDPESEVLGMASPDRSPEQATSDHELRGILEEAVDELPDGFRAVFVLRAVEQLSVLETAEVLQIPEETVKTRLHRARGLLQSAITGRIGVTLPALFDFHRPRCDRVVARVLQRLLSTVKGFPE